jgi:hypothetical protein
LNALGVGYALKLSEGSVAESYSLKDTPASVVSRVLGKYNAISIDHLYDDFTTPQQNKETGIPFFKPIFKDSPFGVEPKVLERGPRNDWWFVSSVVRSYGFELLIIDQDFRVKASDDWRQGEVAKRFRLRAGVNPTPLEGKPIYPILSLSSPTAAVWIASGVGRQVQKDIDEAKKKKDAIIIAEKATAEAKAELEADEGRNVGPKRKRKAKHELTTEQLEGNDKLLQIIEAKVGRAAKHNSGWGGTKKNRFRAGPMSAALNIPGNPESSMLDKAKGHMKRMNHLKGIHVDVQTIGLPDMKPGELVKIDGFAVEGQKEGIFDGIYGVIEVRHQIGLGGFLTTYKAISNFIPRQFPIAAAAAGGIPKDNEDKTPGASQQDRLSVVSRDDFQEYQKAVEGFDPDDGNQF